MDRHGTAESGFNANNRVISRELLHMPCSNTRTSCHIKKCVAAVQQESSMEGKVDEFIMTLNQLNLSTFNVDKCLKS